jgi:RimJ/RimL family protein N-acetyltransferase/predicted GNAT family N-acyltransferase
MTHKNKREFAIDSSRLKARHFQIEDLQILNELHSDEIVVSTTSGTPQTLEETKNELLAIIDHRAKYRVAQMAFFDHGGNFIGRCGIIHRNFATDDDYSYEIRYAIHRRCQGFGIGAEMVFSYIDHIFNDPQIEIDVITAGVRIDGHEASSKILLKLGFSYVGDKIFRGNGKNTRMYELKKKEWLETDNAGTKSSQRKDSTKIAIQVIDFDSDLYQKSLDFRYKILREPLGLIWSKKDLDGEESQSHISAICNQKIVGTVVLKSVSKTRIKLRQMAVDSHLQGNGIGKKLVLFAESLAKSQGFQEVEMIARISALDFYKKLGYKTEGEEFEEVTVRSINMIKNLS